MRSAISAGDCSADASTMVFALAVFGLNFGETFLVVFVVLSILLAPYSGRAGAKLEAWLRRRS